MKQLMIDERKKSSYPGTLVLSTQTASGQRRKGAEHVTASGHESDGEGPGDRKRSTRPPDEQGNAHADDATGSGLKNATSHAESSIDPRIETGHPKNKGGQTETGSDPRIAKGRNVPQGKVRKESSFRWRPEKKST